jgi:succinate dehydrogenase flavin-adding protein (antitoxin of CptAB toxin-antitoxin module)
MPISMVDAIKSQVVFQSRRGALRRHLIIQDVITDPIRHMVQRQTLALVALA